MVTLLSSGGGFGAVGDTVIMHEEVRLPQPHLLIQKDNCKQVPHMVAKENRFVAAVIFS